MEVLFVRNEPASCYSTILTAPIYIYIYTPQLGIFLSLKSGRFVSTWHRTLGPVAISGGLIGETSLNRSQLRYSQSLGISWCCEPAGLLQCLKRATVGTLWKFSTRNEKQRVFIVNDFGGQKFLVHAKLPSVCMNLYQFCFGLWLALVGTWLKLAAGSTRSILASWNCSPPPLHWEGIMVLRTEWKTAQTWGKKRLR